MPVEPDSRGPAVPAVLPDTGWLDAIEAVFDVDEVQVDPEPFAAECQFGADLLGHGRSGEGPEAKG